MFLLDTNIVSERMKARPHLPLLRWIDTTPNDRQFLSVLTLGEIRKGIERSRLRPRNGR